MALSKRKKSYSKGHWWPQTGHASEHGMCACINCANNFWFIERVLKNTSKKVFSIQFSFVVERVRR